MKAMRHHVTFAMTLILLFSVPALAATNVAVFNFQMTTDTPEWRWLEKGLADRIATDFVQAPGLSVVARDEMQLLAQKMNWVPEMATTDAARMGEIRKSLEIEQLLSGIYSVADGRIRIIGQIVDVESRMELARKEIEGPVENVLDLQRQLSAELLAWFTQRPPAEILETLPVWTRSLPAMRALYEGMDLYDQGRYAEAWLQFRQASGEDPAYVEAVYWVGKMYYFMNRYEHARRSLEKFVYMDMAHPRLGDAMVEYVHTYESTPGVSADALLQMYEDLGRRFPNAEVHAGIGWTHSGKIEAHKWFKYKSVQLLGQIGRHKEAALMTRPALSDENGGVDCVDNYRPFCIRNVLEHQAITSEAFVPDVLVKTEWARCRNALLSFNPAASALIRSLPEPVRILGTERKNLDKGAAFDLDSVDIPLILQAPSGYVFESARFYAITEGDDGRMEVAVSLPGSWSGENLQFDPPKSEDLPVARRQGVEWKTLPRRNILLAHCRISVGSPQSGPIVVSGVRVEPVLKRITNPGAIDVQCQDTASLRVHVDGIFARWFPGLVGPLTPGEHTVELLPFEEGMPSANWETRVTVEPGKVTPVAGRLPWQPASRWSSWKTACLGTDYPERALHLQQVLHERPSIQADEDAIRIMWSHQGDLWLSVSTDGERFSPPRKLDLPISSGWLEAQPRLLRDESGRFVLTFVSDRDTRHRHLPYVCWSRDSVHWSAPSLVGEDALFINVVSHDLIEDARGRLVWLAACMYDGVKIRTSRDGSRWEQVAQVRPVHNQGYITDAKLFQFPDGRLELYVIEHVNLGNYYFVRFVSQDLKKWDKAERGGEFVLGPGGSDWEWYLSAMYAEGRPWLLAQTYNPQDLSSKFLAFTEGADRKWREVPHGMNSVSGLLAAAFDPHWGCLLACQTPDLPGFLWPGYGPYFLRGSNLDALFPAGDEPAPTEDRLAKAQAPEPSYSIPRYGKGTDGRIDDAIVVTKKEPPETSEAQPRAKTTPGTLTYVPGSESGAIVRQWVKLDGAQHFKTLPPGSGTVHPNALGVTICRGPTKIALALDSESPDAQHFDRLRIDTTGRGDFRNAVTIPRSILRVHKYDQYERDFKYEYRFEQERVELNLGQQKVPVQVDITYSYRDVSRQQYLWGGLWAAAEGTCRFGDQVHRIRLCDGNSNLRIDDPAKPLFDGARLSEAGIGDSIYVDIGNGVEEYAAQAFYGQPVLVDGRWWTVKVTEDGTKVSAELYDFPTGSLRIDHPFWRTRLVNEGKILIVHGGRELVPIPVGRYTMGDYDEWPADKPNESTDRLQLGASSFRGPHGVAVEVAAGQTQEVVVGSPVKAVLSARRDGEAFLFDFSYTDAAGRTPLYIKWNPEVIIVISDSSGKPLSRITKYWSWWMLPAREDWKIPYGLKGTFRATIEFPSDTFPVECEPVTFTIE